MTSSANNLPAVILASASPRRKQLLKLLGFPFSVNPSSITESYDNNESAAEIVQRLAREKAKDVAGRQAGAIVIGADTLVVGQQKILGKPKDEAEARRMLRRLSGDTHRVMTGVTILKTDKTSSVTREDTFHCTTDVWFARLEDSDIDRYIATGQPMDKAGAYGIQDDWTARFITHMEGTYHNVMGLPVHSLYYHLKTWVPALLERH